MTKYFINRRTFFTATAEVLAASVTPVKAVEAEEISLEKGDIRHLHRWEYWDGVTWVPCGEERCTINEPFCKNTRLHYHPGGKKYSTAWLEDERYSTIVWSKDGVQK